MNLSPPEPPSDPPVPTPQAATANFDEAQMSAHGLDDGARIAILFPGPRIVYATSPALALFAVRDIGELEIRMLQGEGTSARRLRHLAATLPIGGTPRLERLRFFTGRRPTNLNLRCARIATPQGGQFLLLSAGAAEQGVVPPARSAPPGTAEMSAKARFLWTLDAQGRFGDPHPALVSTVGANSPRQGETVDAWARRIGVEPGDELARVLGARATFSDLSVDLPVAGVDRKVRTALSAAPSFDRNREFAGYRGFGVIGEVFAAPNPRPFSAAAEARPPDKKNVPAPNRGAEAVDDPEKKEVVGGAKVQDESGADSASLIAGAAQISTDSATAGPTRLGIPPHDEGPTGTARDEAPRASGRTPAGAGGPEPSPGDIDVAASGPPEPAHQDVSLPDATEGRSAEIYVLRQSASSSAPQTKVVPIRPGALDPPGSRDGAQGAPSGSVELSTSERDAFREIARALVGRTPASRVERLGEANPAVAARDPLDHPFAPPPQLPPTGAVAQEDETVRRNAGAMLDRLPIGLLVARDARALYLNRMLLDLLEYRDLAHFQAADGLAAIFRGRDPQSIPPQEGDALWIVRSNGELLAAEGHAQSIVWDNGPATLFTLRRSPDAATDFA